MTFDYLNKQIEKKGLRHNQILQIGVPGADIKTGRLTIFQLGLTKWKEMVYKPLQELVLTQLLAQFHADRLGESSMMGTVQRMLESFVKMHSFEKHPENMLSSYVSGFETEFLRVCRLSVPTVQCHFSFSVLSSTMPGGRSSPRSNLTYGCFYHSLQATDEFYQREAGELVAVLDCSSYMIKAESRITEEIRRGETVLNPSTRPKLAAVLADRLVKAHIPMMRAECRGLLNRQQVSDLSRMYRLLSRVDGGLVTMLEVLEAEIKSDGLKRIGAVTGSASSYATMYVDALVGLHCHYTTLIRNAFDEDPAFVGALDKACRSVLNSRPKAGLESQAPMLLAKYCDGCLKKSAKSGSDIELEGVFTKVITLFSYVDDKDLFQKFYSKHLAKRLIHFTSLSDEAESLMISKLKQVCGYDYTSKLQQMFTDMQLSAGVSAKFGQTEMGGLVIKQTGFKALVLQSGAWPLGGSPSVPFTAPSELAKCMTYFDMFYDSCVYFILCFVLPFLQKSE